MKNLSLWPWTDSDVVQIKLEMSFGLHELKGKHTPPNSKKAVESKEPAVEALAPEQVPQKDSTKGVWSSRLRSLKHVTVGEDASA